MKSNIVKTSYSISQRLTILIIVNASLGVIGTSHSESSDRFYVFMFAYFILYLFFAKRITVPRVKAWNIALSMVFIWIYGMIVGIVSGNNPTYIFRNFAGMLLYVFFLFLYSSKLRTETLEKLLLGLSVFSCLLTIFGYMTAIKMQMSVIFSIPVLNSFSPGYGVYYDSSNLMYIAYAYSLYMLLIMKKIKIRYLIMVALDLFASTVCMDVSAFVLGVLVFAGLMLVLAFQKKTASRKVETTIIIIFVLLCFVGPILFNAFFSDSDMGNARRWNQIEYVIGNFKVFGHGLGATYSSDIGSEYAIEAIFLDIFYKFGIFALVIIYSYVYTIIEAIRIVLWSKKNPYSVIPLACMGYLFLGLSNPVIFAPASVILHCCSMLLIIRFRRMVEGLS